MLHIYGIPNCDSVKKALAWLKQNDVPFVFHDFKKEGVTDARLKKWCKKAGWEKIFNSKSSTWKNIKTAYDNIPLDESAAIAVMTEHTSVIKRPVIEYNNKILTGFNENDYIETILNQS